MWFEEIHNDFFKQGLRVERKLAEVQSEYQKRSKASTKRSRFTSQRSLAASSSSTATG